jgi:LPS-assembly lipoprotein
MRQRLTSTTLLLGSLLLLSACGFQLRGAGGTQLPEDWYSLYLVSPNSNSELTREVQSRFAANGVQWAAKKSEANYIVKIGPEKFSQRNLSINAEARAAEFELTLRTRFTVNDNSGKPAIKETDASVVRQMENDPRNVVGKAEEIRILKGEMRADLAQQIMRRIGFYAASTQ